jgi:peptidyl-prolyl cis-trans isomerase D
MQWAFNDKTKIGEVADQVFQSDDQYVVVALKDVYKVGYATLDQVRNMMENQVRIEKRAQLLIARAEEARKTSSDIASVAAKLNAAVDTLDSISFNDYFVGPYGMEPKLQAAIAAAPDNAFIGPIQGASGVYMVKINSRADNPQAVPGDAIRNQMQQSYSQKMRGVMQVLKDNVKIIDQRYRFF